MKIHIKIKLEEVKDLQTWFAKEWTCQWLVIKKKNNLFSFLFSTSGILLANNFQ